MNYLKAGAGEQSAFKLTDVFTDITGAELVNLVIDHSRGVLHVNVNGLCVLRVCRIERPIEIETIGEKK